MLYLNILISLCAIAVYALDKESLKARVLQEKYETLHRDDFMQYFNKQNHSFQIAHYKHLEKADPASLVCAQFYKNDLPEEYISHDPELFKNLPQEFDARKKWPHCETIREVYDQGTKCGSCWTFGTATTASDRLCIHHNIQASLSEQDLQCCKRCTPNGIVCKGGYPAVAFDFWVQQGLVTQQCKPYNEPELWKRNICQRKCINGKNYSSDKHRGTRSYTVQSDEDNIRYELFKNGPIQAGFTVFKDFLSYKKGVYEHMFGDMAGRHSVRVIGYGVERGTPYWLAVNSYNRSWGDNGLFKVKRYAKGLEFEKLLISGY